MANLTISVNDSDKQQFSDFCEQIGLSSSSLLNMFIKTVIREERVPFEISLKKNQKEEKDLDEIYFKPNRKTIKAMKEGDALVAAENTPTYGKLDDLWESLEK